MSTPLANPRRTKLDSWPTPYRVDQDDDQAGQPADTGRAAQGHGSGGR